MDTVWRSPKGRSRVNIQKYSQQMPGVQSLTGQHRWDQALPPPRPRLPVQCPSPAPLPGNELLAPGRNHDPGQGLEMLLPCLAAAPPPGAGSGGEAGTFLETGGRHWGTRQPISIFPLLTGKKLPPPRLRRRAPRAEGSLVGFCNVEVTEEESREGPPCGEVSGAPRVLNDGTATARSCHQDGEEGPGERDPVFLGKTEAARERFGSRPEK